MSAAAVARERASGFDRGLIAPMVLGSILNPINSSMIAVALIPIGQAFHVLPGRTAWLVSALYLATATGQPVVGRLVDRYGPRTLYLIGTALVGVAGLIGVLAPSLGVLIVARVLLGLGTCAGYPAAMYLIRSESRRTGVDSPGGVLTMLSVSAQTIVVVGPTLGGLLIAAGGWRSIFAVNIPLAIACLILGVLRLPKNQKSAKPEMYDGKAAQEAGADAVDGRSDLGGSFGRGAGSGGDAAGHAVAVERERFDYVGILLFAGMLTGLMLFLMAPSAGDLWILGAGAAAGGLFAWRELRIAVPFIDLRVFGGNAPLVRTYLRSLLASTTSYAFLYGFTQWLEEGRGLSASHAGLVLLPMSLVAIGVSALTGRRAGFRYKLIVGAVMQLVASALMLLLNSGSAVWLAVLISVVCGVPQGLNNLANQNAVYYQADPARMGASAGLLRTFLYLGAMVASAAYGAFFADGAGTGGLHELAVFLIAVAVLLIVLVLTDRSLSRVGTTTSEDT